MCGAICGSFLHIRARHDSPYDAGTDVREEKLKQL